MTLLSMNWEVITWTSITLAFFVIMFLLVTYIISFRNMKKQRKKVQENALELKTGDKVIFGGGIYGTVTKVMNDEEKINVKIADETIITISRFAVQFKDND